MAVATVLFAGGILFGYYVALPKAIPFLLGFDADLYNIQVRARDYYRFATIVLLGLGFLFLTPILVIGLVRLRIVSAQTFRAPMADRRLMCTVVAMILPAVDPVTTLIMMAPILTLYFGSICGRTDLREEIEEKNWSQHAEPLIDRRVLMLEVAEMGTIGLWGGDHHRGIDRTPLRRQALARHGTLARTNSREFKDALAEAPEEFRDGMNEDDAQELEPAGQPEGHRPELELEQELEAERQRRESTSASAA